MIKTSCCSNVVHLQCAIEHTQCTHCSKLFTDEIKDVLNHIQRNRFEKIKQILIKELLERTKRQKARLETQFKIDSTITIAALQAAWNSNQSKKYNRMIKKQRKEAKASKKAQKMMKNHQ